MKTRIALFSLMACAALVLSACGGANANDPKAVAEAFLTALTKGDYTKAAEYGTDETKSMLTMLASFSDQMSEEDKAAMANTTFTIDNVADDGDNKIVTYTMTAEGQSQEQTITLVKQDNGYKVNLNKEM